MGTYNKYTEEQEQFLMRLAPTVSRRELTEMFNFQFGTRKNERAIKSWCNRRGYNSANDGRFKDGHESWQKGLHGEDYKSHYKDIEAYERIRSGAHNRKHKLGDEIVHNKTILVVTSVDYDSKKSLWARCRPKSHIVWEQHNGKIPDNHCIIFLDGNSLNCDIGNLYCMPKKYRTLMAQNKWYTDSPEHTLAAIKWCELHEAMKEGANNGL